MTDPAAHESLATVELQFVRAYLRSYAEEKSLRGELGVQIERGNVRFQVQARAVEPRKVMTR